MTDRTIGSIPFIDSIVRPVFLDANGRQYVLDNDGDRVYGVWINVDEPETVNAQNAGNMSRTLASSGVPSGGEYRTLT